MFELTVHTFTTGETAEWSVWIRHLPLNDLLWDPALAEAWSVVDPTLSAEWPVMVPQHLKLSGLLCSQNLQQSPTYLSIDSYSPVFKNTSQWVTHTGNRLVCYVWRCVSEQASVIKKFSHLA